MERFNSINETLLSLIRTWWRPVSCIGIAGTVLVNGIILPLSTKAQPDLTGLAALVTAVAAAFAVREWGKIKGDNK